MTVIAIGNTSLTVSGVNESGYTVINTGATCAANATGKINLVYKA